MSDYAYIRVSTKDQKTDMPPEFEQVKEKWEKGEISLTAGGRLLGVSRSTFYRRCTGKK